MTGELTVVQKMIYSALLCPYCGDKPTLQDSSVVYGKSYGPIWRCTCGAFCGCHPGTNKPLGRVAKPELRRLKKEAHEHFDRIWKTRKLTRTAAYAMLSRRLGIPKKYTHIGMFSESTCKKVIEISKEFLR
jgi:hypothetical protein